MAAGHSPIAVYAAIVANGIIAIVKFVAAFFTGSAAMLSEGIHSVVDTGNQMLLLFGIHRSKRPADESHPFGHGKDLYFWSLIVAVLLFSLGGGMSLYEGITHFQHPGELSDPTWNYVVLGIAFVVEAIAWTTALRELLRQKHEEASVWQAMRESKDPAVYVVVAEDTAAMIGVVVAAVGIFLAHHFQNPMWDAIASMTIGVILGAVAIFLTYESKGLMLGESADMRLVNSVKEIAGRDEAVEHVSQPLTMHFGPHNILLVLAVEFKSHLTALEVVKSVDRLKATIQKACPAVQRVFIEADSLKESAETG